MAVAMADTRPFVPRGEDDGADRRYWWVSQCHLADECSKASWKKAHCVSYVGPDDAIAKVRTHLQISALHNRSEEETDTLVEHIEVETAVETAQEREEYRQQLQRTGSHQGEEGKSKGESKGSGSVGKGKGFKGKKGKDKGPYGKRSRVGEDDNSDKMDKLVESVSRLVDGLAASASAASSSSGLAPLAVTQRPMSLQVGQTIQVPVRSANMLLESLSRAQEALEHAKQATEAVARVARQLEMEAGIIDRASMALQQLLRESPHGR